MSKRLITIYWDVVAQLHRDSSGNKLNSADYPFAFFKEKPMINVQLVTDASLTPYTGLEAGYALRAVVDYDFDRTLDVMCLTEDADINTTGSWWLGGDSSGIPTTADVTSGELSIPLDANTTRFEAVLGTTPEKSGSKLEIVAYDGVDVVAVFRMPFRTFNIMYDAGVPLTASDSFARVSNGQLQLWNPDQSTWHTVYVKGGAGVEYLVLGPGE